MTSPPSGSDAPASWDFPGWGTAEHIQNLGVDSIQLRPLDSTPAHRLGVWKATAICVIVITSSCLYVVALCAIHAGRYAPLALALVAAVLYLFRGIYAEVGSALPLNGGTYNVLLNTTSKAKAAAAACLTILSYMATAVISAYEAMQYAHNLWSAIPIIAATIGLLAFFAALNVVGISESADVALVLFAIHILTLIVLLLAGGWTVRMISVDAVLVLSGAVLTSFVGVTGLVRRMSLDRCLPQFLLNQNRWRNTNHWILLSFFVLCSSILLASSGDVEVLAGVYTLSFLAVMALFAVGNILLKLKRARLPRTVRAPWPSVIAGLLAVLAGLAGNLFLNPAYLEVFLVYFAVCAGAVAIMFLRVQILRGILAASRAVVARVRNGSRFLNRRIMEGIRRINSFQVIYFSRGDDLEALNRAAVYVLGNELTTRMTVVHCYVDATDIPPTLAENLKTIDHLYPRIRIDLVLVKAPFGPQVIERLSQRFGVPKNYMFIGTPGGTFPHKLSELGGVRMIL